MIEILPAPYRCEGICGRGAVCADIMWTNGYCNKPDFRDRALEYEKNIERPTQTTQEAPHESPINT